jgi:hypothetical protein
MNLEQLCCLHEAIKNRMPIPRNTLIKTVEKAFEIEGWTPQNKHGFSIIEETPSSPEEFDCLPLTYSIQTQRWNSLSNGQLGAIDDEIFEIQETYNKNVKSNPELVEKVINSLFEARIDAMLPTAIEEIQKEYGTAHELVDALLHMNPRQMDYLKSISEEHDKMDEFKEGLWVLDEILEYPWSSNETDELLFAVQNQINPEPRNSLSNTVSKKQEPEYHSDKDCSFRTFSFVSVLCLKLFNKEKESHMKLKRNILHIGYRLSFTNEWDPLMHVEHQPVIPEIMQEYQKSNESVLFVRDSLILAVIKGREIQKLGLSKIEEYFNILIDSDDHEQAVRQSLEFNALIH